MLGTLFAVALAACGRGGAATLNEPDPARARRVGELRTRKFEVKFVGIDEDSRCPSDVACVWAGEVIVRLSLRRDSRQQGVAVKETQGLAVDGYTIDRSAGPAAARLIQSGRRRGLSRHAENHALKICLLSASASDAARRDVGT